MYFDDGSNPTDDIVRSFIQLAEDVIEKRKQKVAVHCKAGLGRTGVLIGGKRSISPISICRGLIPFSLLYLQVRVLGAGGHRLHAYRPTRYGRWPTTAIHGGESDEMGSMGKLKRVDQV